MTIILMILFFVLGLVIGSFLNVVIFRYNTHKKVTGRSHCMVCHNPLRWYELFPVFSYIFLGGRCRKCKTKISIQYPLVEFTSGLIFLGLFLKFKEIFYLDTPIFIITMIYYAFMFSLLLVISVYDLKHKIIPDKLSIILGAVAFMGLFFFSENGFNIHIPTIWQFLSGLIISVPFALIWLLSRGKWMGLGDAKLAIGIGWLVGMTQMLSGVVLSFWSGAVVGILLIVISRRTKKYGIKSEIPFAPFLVLGAILAFVFGIQLFQIWF